MKSESKSKSRPRPATAPLPHQRAIVDRIVGACPGQHGILVAHRMGAGKTFTMLLLLQNFETAAHVIVCPSSLRHVYEQESLKLLGRGLNPGTVVVTYDDLPALLRNSPATLRDCVLVMDEAHHLVDMVKRMDVAEAHDMSSILSVYPRKAFLMTGTPVYNEVADLVLLVNVAAGRQVIPTKADDFVNAFTRPRLLNSALFGQFVSALSGKFSTVVVTAATGVLSLYVVSRASPHRNLVTLGRYAFPKSPPLIRPLGEILFKAFVRYQKPKKSDTVFNKVLNQVLTTQHGQAATVFALTMAVVVLPTMYILATLRILLDSRADHHDPMSYRAFDYAKMKRVLSPYVSFFQLQPGVDGVPTTSEQEVPIVYTMHQTAVWSRFVYDLLTDEDIDALGIRARGDLAYDNVNNLAKHVTRDVYAKWGRMISNTAPAGSFPPKYEACFRIMCGEREGGTPRRAVVYADFAKSTQRFSEFLQSKVGAAPFRFDAVLPDDTLSRRAAVLRRFAEGAIDVLVLHAGMYEGLSVLGALQMHILDPPLEYRSLAQVMGRVVRLRSHAGLPSDMQHVTYYHYVASFSPEFLAFLTTALQSAGQSLGNQVPNLNELSRLWEQSQACKQKLPSLFNPSVLETTTAEALTAHRLRPVRELMMKLETSLASIMEVPALQCCPLYEEGEPDAACIMRGLPPCATRRTKRVYSVPSSSRKQKKK